jgi:hypothetical protein
MSSARSTKMVSAALGDSISDVEVTNVSGHGLWILVSGEELFLPFDKFPWFRDAPIRKVTNVERPQPHHLYWPDLDVDLHVDSIRDPERFPLLSK